MMRASCGGAKDDLTYTKSEKFFSFYVDANCLRMKRVTKARVLDLLAVKVEAFSLGV